MEIDQLVAIVQEKRSQLCVPNEPEPSGVAEAVQTAARRLTLRTPDPEQEARWREEEARRRQADIVRAKQQRWDRLISHVGRRYREASLEAYEVTHDAQRAVMEAMRGYAANIKQEVEAGDGVVLFGPSGTGKDFLLVALAREAIRAGVRDIVHVNGMDLFGEVRDAMDSDVSERSIIERYEKPDVLILSDPLPPSGSLTDFQSAILFRLLDARYRSCKPTWATMNVATGSEAEQRMGVSLVDRLRDGALCLFCNWPSYRKARMVPKAEGKGA